MPPRSGVDSAKQQDQAGHSDSSREDFKIIDRFKNCRKRGVLVNAVKADVSCFWDGYAMIGPGSDKKDMEAHPVLRK